MTLGAAKELFWLAWSWVQPGDPRLPSVGQGLEPGLGGEQAASTSYC